MFGSPGPLLLSLPSSLALYLYTDRVLWFGPASTVAVVSMLVLKGEVLSIEKFLAVELERMMLKVKMLTMKKVQ